MARILWIDDYAGRGTQKRVGFDALIYFVEKNGHAVTIASTPDEIDVTLAKIAIFDLLILDIIMDPLSFSSTEYYQYGGIDIIARLVEAGASISIIVLSVVPPRMLREEAMRRGLDLVKARVRAIRRKGLVTPTVLADLVEKCLVGDDGQLEGAPS